MHRNQIPLEFWDRAEIVDRLLKRKTCLASGQGSCDGPVISAHTIPRSQLSHLATNGHVKAFKYRPADIAKNDGNPEVGDKGIGDFSVLNCFCRTHDAKLFAPVENVPLLFDPQQLALLHFRAIFGELYKKNAQVDGFRSHLEHFSQKKKDLEQVKLLNGMIASGESGLRDIEVSFSQISADLYSEIYDNVCGLVIEFQRQPSIMAVGAFAPEWDYSSKKLQAMSNLDAILDHVSLSIMRTDDGARVAYVWSKASDIGKQFAESLLQQSVDKFSTLIIQTVFHSIENVCMNPQWWDDLKSVERRVLSAWMIPAIHTAETLKFTGVKFDDWGYQSHRLIN